MGVEVKQLTVKSTVTSGEDDAKDKPKGKGDVDVDALREQILEACKELTQKMLSDSRDR